MILLRHLAYCGYDCTGCPIYQATAADDADLRARLAEKYTSPEHPFRPGDMDCLGCLSPAADHNKLCGTCAMRNCAGPKGYVTCAQCPDYPCAVIERSLPAGGDGRARLDALVDPR